MKIETDLSEITSTLDGYQVQITALDNACDGYATVLQMDAYVASYAAPIINGTITGQVVMYAGSSTPSGWLLCDGTLYSTTTYASLYNAIGTTWGSGTGTFAVPDFRGIFPKGAGTTSRSAGKDASGDYYAATFGTYSTDQMQGHKHKVGMNNDGAVISGNLQLATSGNTESFNSLSSAGSQTGGGSDGLSWVPAADGTNGAPRTGHTTEPQSAGINFIIKI